MSLETLTQKSHTVSRGFTYNYYTHNARAGKPTVLLIHGWPDTAEVWAELIVNHLIPAGNGILAIDDLGSGGSSKPSQLEDYDFEKQADDIKEILDQQGLDKVVVLGHDWGCGIASRFYNFHSSRVLALTITNVNYFAPSPQPFDVTAAIEYTKARHGLGFFYYWHFFAGDADAPEVLLTHIDSLWSALHPADPGLWRETFTTEGGFRRWLESDRIEPVQAYATEERKKAWIAELTDASRPDNTGGNGFAALQKWYRTLYFGTQDVSGKRASEQGQVNVTVPYLLVRAEGDIFCRVADFEDQKKAGLLGDDAEIVNITKPGAAHWVMLSHPELYGEIITGWLARKGF